MFPWFEKKTEKQTERCILAKIDALLLRLDQQEIPRTKKYEEKECAHFRILLIISQTDSKEPGMHADAGVHCQFHTLSLNDIFIRNRRENSSHTMRKRFAKQLE